MVKACAACVACVTNVPSPFGSAADPCDLRCNWCDLFIATTRYETNDARAGHTKSQQRTNGHGSVTRVRQMSAAHERGTRARHTSKAHEQGTRARHTSETNWGGTTGAPVPANACGTSRRRDGRRTGGQGASRASQSEPLGAPACAADRPVERRPSREVEAGLRQGQPAAVFMHDHARTGDRRRGGRRWPPGA